MHPIFNHIQNLHTKPYMKSMLCFSGPNYHISSALKTFNIVASQIKCLIRSLLYIGVFVCVF